MLSYVRTPAWEICQDTSLLRGAVSGKSHYCSYIKIGCLNKRTYV